MKKKAKRIGRPPIEDRRRVKRPISIKLPDWLLTWMDRQPNNRARLIEDALVKVYRIKPPT